jgi:hypothetical protein
MSELEIYKGMVKKMKDDEIKEFNEEIYVEMLENGELYDYITNLQQENQELKKKNDSLGETNLRINGDLKVAKQDRIEYSNELTEYKSRCEKAVEYIKELDDETDDTCLYQMTKETKEYLLNLLNGRSDE